MVSPNQQRNSDTEAKVLERLKSAYKQRGFAFFSPPKREMIPAFLGGYVPDALAIRDRENVLIEVKLRQNTSSEPMFADIRRKIADHKDWKLDVVYAAERRDDSISIDPPRLDILHQQINEVRELDRTNHRRAAFVLAWSLLEATLNHVRSETRVDQLRSPGQVIQSLATEGYVSRDVEKKLRELSVLRNRIIHGDIGVSVTSNDVEYVLAAIRETLAEGAQ